MKKKEGDGEGNGNIDDKRRDNIDVNEDKKEKRDGH